MVDNTALWDRLGKTDPKHTKPFTRGGGFRGTAIKPMFSYRRMTEEFGPCGEGWGVGAPSFQVVPGTDGETLVYCTASIWYGSREKVVFGVGGDKVIAKFSNGAKSDDEAFKKAFTDAVTNALKLIGVGADVHMGMFDDSKYVNEIKEEFASATRSTADYPHDEAAAPRKSSAQLKRDGFWPDFERELDECTTLLMLGKFRTTWREKAMVDGWTAAWKAAAKDRIEGRERIIMNEMDAAELAGVPLKDALEKSLSQHPIMAG